MGAGTGTVGGSIPLRGGIVLDTQRLSRPLEIDLPGGSVQVGAGVSGNRLEELLAHAGATLGHFPASLPAARPALPNSWMPRSGRPHTWFDA